MYGIIIVEMQRRARSLFKIVSSLFQVTKKPELTRTTFFNDLMNFLVHFYQPLQPAPRPLPTTPVPSRPGPIAFFSSSSASVTILRDSRPGFPSRRWACCFCSCAGLSAGISSVNCNYPWKVTQTLYKCQQDSGH